MIRPGLAASPERESTPWGVPEVPESSPTAPSPAAEPSTPRLPEVEPELVPVEPRPARRRRLERIWNDLRDVGPRVRSWP
jgi:hypothetical protein